MWKGVVHKQQSVLIGTEHSLFEIKSYDLSWELFSFVWQWRVEQFPLAPNCFVDELNKFFWVFEVVETVFSEHFLSDEPLLWENEFTSLIFILLSVWIARLASKDFICTHASLIKFFNAHAFDFFESRQVQLLWIVQILKRFNNDSLWLIFM